MRQRRWLELIKDYNLEVHYHPGKANVIADALSRKSHCNCHMVESPIATLCAEMEGMNLGMLGQGTASNLKLVPTLREQIITAAQNDKAIASIKQRLKDDVGQRGKADQLKSAGQLQPLAIPSWKSKDIHMDFIVGLPRTQEGFDSIWVIVDRLTKIAHFIPVNTVYQAKTYAELYISRI